MCGLPKSRCLVFLKNHGGHVANTLKALIDLDVVRGSDLDPDTVPEDLFARAVRRANADMAGMFTKQVKRLTKTMPKQIQAPFEEQMTKLAASASTATDDRVELAGWGTYARVKRRGDALKKNPVTLKLPPFPPLTLKIGEWVGADVLKSWSGFGEKRGSKGKVGISISRPWTDKDDRNPVPPAKEMVAAYAHLKLHEGEIRDAVCAAFQRHINDTLIGEYGWDDEPIDDAKDLKKMLEIGSVHLLSIARDGLAYLGFFFQCTWDPEHAAGALIHGSRVITVRDNEACGDEFAALADGGKHLRAWTR
jgi:hypothetical protein